MKLSIQYRFEGNRLIRTMTSHVSTFDLSKLNGDVLIEVTSSFRGCKAFMYTAATAKDVSKFSELDNVVARSPASRKAALGDRKCRKVSRKVTLEVPFFLLISGAVYKRSSSSGVLFFLFVLL